MNNTQQPQQSVPKKNNTVLIIVLVAVFAVILLGVGGYFAWKYFKGKVTTSADTTTTKSGTVSLKEIETLYKYPNATITKTDRTKGGSAVSQIDSETVDNLTTVYNYYINLATTKKLTVSRKTLETDGSTSTVSIEGSGYTVDIFSYKTSEGNGTEISEYFYGDKIKDDTATATTTTTTTTPSASTSTTKTTISTDYVISDSNTRVISESELTNLTPWQLKVARNEIYARHGREFVHKDLQCYFNGKGWYKANPSFSETVLSSTETKNIATIQAYEIKTNSPLQSKDTGC